MWSNVTHFQSVRLGTFPESDAEDFETKEVRYMQVYTCLGKKIKGKRKKKKKISSSVP